jgi:DNA replication and repair protein RecF
VRLRQLRLENLRAFRSLDLELGAGWNVFLGANGAGKTTLLEAAYLLSHARSFRGGARDVLTRHGAGGYSVFGGMEGASASPVRLGLSRNAGRLEARVNNTSIGVAELLRHAAVVCFEPGSHELISGAAELRRRFMDWGVFHVEQDFLGIWRSFQRSLKQRNALLRGGGTAAELDAWDQEFVASGVGLAAMRRRYMGAFAPVAIGLMRELLGELGEARLVLEDGWNADVDPLEQLAVSRDDDFRRGFTTLGPHRADWTISFALAPRREHLSRGQEKLCALACVLAQANVYAAQRGEWPVICVDDLASELDNPHQERLLRSLAAVDAQMLITGTHEPRALAEAGVPVARFHVEPGSVTALL